MFLLTKTYREFSGKLLLLLFCSYFAAVTFFPHNHIIEGIQVVHSHPYKSQSGNTPFNHSHTKNEFVLIQFLSSFIAIAAIIYAGSGIHKKTLIRKLLLPKENLCFNSYCFLGHRPRAPAF